MGYQMYFSVGSVFLQCLTMSFISVTIGSLGFYLRTCGVRLLRCLRGEAPEMLRLLLVSFMPVYLVPQTGSWGLGLHLPLPPPPPSSICEVSQQPSLPVLCTSSFPWLYGGDRGAGD